MSFTLEFKGRVAWVTGGASGIGAAIVESFHRTGATVLSFDKSHAARTRVEGGREIQVPIDLSARAELADALQSVLDAGHIPDILVNAAGITADGVVWKLEDEDWDEVIDVNLGAAFRMTRAAIPHMRERKSGVVINVASINALRGKVGQSNYAASKGGLVAFTRAVAKEVGKFGIRVNAIAPGFVETPMTAALSERVRQEAIQESLLGRMASPQDIANAVLFLASPLAAHITGHVLVVDGGQTT